MVARILIVDDEDPLRELLAAVLAAAGHTPVQAGDGREAISLVAQARPDLILSDVMMPGLSGPDLCRRLKAAVDTTSIPVILMSAAGAPLAAGAGAAAFLAKPFALDTLEALVQRWLPPAPSGA